MNIRAMKNVTRSKIKVLKKMMSQAARAIRIHVIIIWLKNRKYGKDIGRREKNNTWKILRKGIDFYENEKFMEYSSKI